MPDLDFHVESIAPEAYSAVPLLVFKIRIDQADGAQAIQAVALRCQIRLEPGRRKYGPQEERRLYELFGRREQWSQTLRSMLWTHASTIVGPFVQSAIAELPVPCTFDFNVAMTKYFDALCEGEAALSLLFSGTVFHQNAEGALQAAPISWEKEAAARLPAATWRDMMHHHYPNTAWLCLDKSIFDRLHEFKAQGGHGTWDATLARLLDAAAPEARP